MNNPVYLRYSANIVEQLCVIRCFMAFKMSNFKIGGNSRK
jgi:hypothetical protein